MKKRKVAKIIQDPQLRRYVLTLKNDEEAQSCTNTTGSVTATYVLTLTNDEEARSCTNSTGSATVTYVMSMIKYEEARS